MFQQCSQQLGLVMFNKSKVWYHWICSFQCIITRVMLHNSFKSDALHQLWDSSAFSTLCVCVLFCTVGSFSVQHNLPQGENTLRLSVFYPSPPAHKRPANLYLAPVGGTVIAWRPPPLIWESPGPAGTTAQVWGSYLWTLWPLMIHTTWRETQIETVTVWTVQYLSWVLLGLLKF